MNQQPTRDDIHLNKKREMKRIKELFENWIKHGFSHYDVFDDFLNITILSVINLNKWNKEFEENEKDFQRIVKKYNWDIELFSKILACFIDRMQETKETLKDWIWDYFMQEVSHGEHWQFFTPDHIAWFMSKITINQEEQQAPSYMDCACWSSRTLLQAQKGKRWKSYWIDIDKRCVLMSVFNHYFYWLRWEFILWNALMNEMKEVFQVLPPFIYHTKNE
jgi:type I restriction-modification system DNA methylase subunit